MKILLLEDNSSDADLTKRGLVATIPNCSIELAPTIEHAKKLINSNALFDVALLDVNLPDGNSLEFLMGIRQRKLNFPAIMVTGSGDEDIAVSALKAGADDYVVKRSGYISRLPNIINLAIANFKKKDLFNSKIIKVLYIEHHPADIDFTHRHLAQYAPNIQINSVASAEEALLKLELDTFNYNVILMDYHLPGMNALELIKTLRQVKKISIPIILVTGQGNEELAVQALKIGANDYLTKSNKYLYRLPSLIENSYQHYELIKKQEALLESESKYRLLADNSADVIFVLDLDLNYTYISPAVKILRGYEPEEAIKQKLNEVLTPASYEKTVTAFSTFFSKEPKKIENPIKQRSIELEIIRKDKTTIWAEVKASIMLDRNNNPIGIIGVTRDISERKSILEEYRKLSWAVEQSPELIIITDTKGCIEYVNPTYTDVTGYTFQELLGSKLRILKSEHTSKEIHEKIWNTINSGKEWKGEFCNKKKDGSIYWVDVSITAIKSPNGTITNFLAVKTDITEKKKMIDELIIAKEKAEESDRLKTAFLHNISHEIRTPLNAIVGFSSILTNHLLAADKRQHYSDIIGKSSNQLLSIISNIINISSIEAGQEKLNLKSVNLNEKCKLIYQQFELIAEKRNITLKCDTPLSDNEATIITDETKFSQILTNLLDNSLKFITKGHVHYGYKLKNGFLEFFVEDSGIGISSDMHQKIFKRFRQVETTDSRQFGGSGLGLSISKGYVELLGGEIWLTSEPGKGSVFYFSVPYKTENSIVETNTTIPPEIKIANEKQKTLLVAEDEDFNFMLIEELLSDSNFKLIRAITGLEAVEICKSTPNIDLVLMDIKMPVMDGYEATKLIKNFKSDLPIIAQTAYSVEKSRTKALEFGCADFISKPFKKEILLSKIKQLLPTT